MARYIGRRLLHLVGILIAVSFLTFLLMYLSPGDAAMKKLNAQGVAVSEDIPFDFYGLTPETDIA